MIHFSVVIIENLGSSHFSSLLLNLLVSHFVCPWYWTFLLLFLCLLFNICFHYNFNSFSNSKKSLWYWRSYCLDRFRSMQPLALCLLLLGPKNGSTSLLEFGGTSYGGSRNTSKIVWISWERVCSLKEKCGLGIKNLYLFNISLLSKWRWRFLQESLQFGPLLLDSDMVVLSLIYHIWPTKLVCF